VAERRAPRPWHTDGWIALALTDFLPAQWVAIEDLIGAADDWNHAILVFDEVSFGLARLEALGLFEVRRHEGRLELQATEATRVRRHTVRAGTLGAAVDGMSRAIGASAWPGLGEEDRSLGRLPGLTEAEFDAEVRAYRHEASRLVEGLLAARRRFR
jgi:hypothetical protein